MKKNKLISLGLFLLFWFLVVETKIVKPIFLPPLQDVFAALIASIFSTDGFQNVFQTLGRTTIGFGIGASIAIPIGIILGFFKALYDPLELFIDFFRSVPVTAMFPLFLIFFGFGNTSLIAMGVWASGFVVLVNTLHGVWNAKENRKTMALTKQATRMQVLQKIMIFEALPFIFAGLRIAVSWTLIVLVVSEMFVGTRFGLGRQIYNGSLLFDTPMVIAGIILIGIIGYAFNRTVMYLEKRTIHWKT
jgi:NitT/TauT family transport system permease protein